MHVTIIAFLLLSSFVVSGCSSTPESQNIIFRPAVSDSVSPDGPRGPGESESPDRVAGDGEAELDVEVVEFEWPEGFDADPDIDIDPPEDLVGDITERFTISPSVDSFQGGAVVYNYVPNHIYRIFAQPMRTVDLQLQPGESLVSPPAAGDTVTFLVGSSLSYHEGQQRTHIHIKPLYAGRETSLSINTDRRSYHFSVRSFDDVFMPIIAFRYPLDEFREAQNADRQRRAQQRNDIPMVADITELDFNYEIVPMSAHRPSWMPSRVFNDGRKTYIYFPSARRASYAPVLFSVEDGERVLVNYRVSGTMYIVDRVLLRAELVVDINAGNIVTIQRIEG